MKQTFIVIGIDDNPLPWLHPDVVNLIKENEVFSGGIRHHEIMGAYLPESSEWIDITVPLDEVFNQYKHHSRVVVFASGDPLFFGFANTIKRRLPESSLLLYPVFNSLQTLAHKLVLPYDDMHIVSLTGRPWHEFDRALILGHQKIGVLTDRQHTPVAIAERMLEYGYDYYSMYVGEHLGNPEKEQIRRFDLHEAVNSGFEHPNNLILVGNGTFRNKYFGIPDEWFAHLNGRTKMITKAPIRLQTLSTLSLKEKTSFWDIGFCTGSVSIEAKLQFPHLHITSFEIRAEGEELMKQNTRKFGTPGIETVIGDFTDINLSSYPRPDAVFIGGHGGKLKQVVQLVHTLLLPGGTMVFNSVSEESKRLFLEAVKAEGLHIASSLRITVDEHNPIEIMKVTLTL